MLKKILRITSLLILFSLSLYFVIWIGNSLLDIFTDNYQWMLIIGVGITIFIMAFFLFVISLVKSSVIYNLALEKAKTFEVVQNKIGNSFKKKLFGFTGSINTSKFSGKADLAIYLTGEKGKGTLFVKAEKKIGEWEYEYLILKVNSEKFDLLDPLKKEVPNQIN